MKGLYPGIFLEEERVRLGPSSRVGGEPPSSKLPRLGIPDHGTISRKRWVPRKGVGRHGEKKCEKSNKEIHSGEVLIRLERGEKKSCRAARRSILNY